MIYIQIELNTGTNSRTLKLFAKQRQAIDLICPSSHCKDYPVLDLMIFKTCHLMKKELLTAFVQ